MGNLIRFILIVGSIGGLIFYYNVSKASRIAPYEQIPSEDEFYMLQYCLDDSDCETVTWQDCNKCEYSRALNKRFSDYFYDNADYYHYPIGFNQSYCEALKKNLPADKQELGVGRVTCQDSLTTAKVIGAKCDPLFKQCYNECKDYFGMVSKCPYDTYGEKLLDIFIRPSFRDN